MDSALLVRRQQASDYNECYELPVAFRFRKYLAADMVIFPIPLP